MSLHMHPTKPDTFSVALLGSDDFIRRAAAMLHQFGSAINVHSGLLAEALSVVASVRPQLVILECGLRSHLGHAQLLKNVCARIRERQDSAPYIAVALTAGERLRIAGEILFQDEGSLTPSGLVDSFLVRAPEGIPGAIPFHVQLLDLITCVREEMLRRRSGVLALPPLGANGWVQSLADPASRKLWMKWLPRYALYTNESPLVIGATGTGKTNLAFALHLLSGRSGKFVSITPRDFSSSELVQAELFGAVAGAYTGAVDKWGLVKSAEKGTLFIDELQSIDKELQGKLITFIENKLYRRVGSSETISADVRFVFASNRELREMMDQEVLRDDFAYRLERVQLELAPLRARPLDISAALAFALAKIARLRPHVTPVLGVTSMAYRLLYRYSWPGNLRQLENVVAKLHELADMAGSPLITEEHVSEVLDSRLQRDARTPQEVLSHAASTVAQELTLAPYTDLRTGIQRFSELARTSALDATAGDPNAAAALLGEPTALLQIHSNSILRQREVSGLLGERRISGRPFNSADDSREDSS